jgi:hypothetical protein
MSTAELHKLASALDQHEATACPEGVRPADFELLVKTVLQGVHELMNMEQRLASIERRVLQHLDEVRHGKP